MKTLPSTLEFLLLSFLDLISLPFGHSQFSSICLLSLPSPLPTLSSAIPCFSPLVSLFLACFLVYVCVYWPSAHTFCERPLVSPALPVLGGDAHFLSSPCDHSIAFHEYELFCNADGSILKILPAFLFSCPYLSCLSRWPNLSPFSALSCSFLLAFFKPIFLHFSPLPCTAVPLLPPPTPGSFQFIPPGSLLSEDSFPSFLLTYLLLRSFQCSRFRCSLKNCHLQLRDWPDWEKRGHFLGTRGENRKVALMVRKGRLCIIH